MKSRLLAATVLAASLLVVPVASHAQKADSIATRGALAGRGAIGAQIGSSYFFSGGDYAKGANPRLTFIGHFRYQTKNPRWGWQVSPMFTWNGYVSNQDAPFVDPNFPDRGLQKEDYIAYLAGVASQVQYFGGGGRSRWHVGAGPSFHHVKVENQRRTVQDPVSNARHQSTHLGLNAEFGYERFTKALPNTALEFTVAWHTVFAKDDDKWASGWNDSPMLAEVRFGANYYYDFDRKPKKGAKGAAGARK